MNDISYQPRLDEMTIDEACIQTIRTLAMDAVEQAASGHPGTPMALAPAAYVLWSRHLRFNPANPQWFNRDRFVLSAGHASLLQYVLLHLSGYDLPLEEIRRFRQWQSRTPGHPEYPLTPGLELTTGPLGQGLMNAVGMALAEAHLADIFNRPGHTLCDHATYVFCSDGDMMEGASHEAASVAGHLGLGKLIVLYDDNRISIDGPTPITLSDDTARRFEGYHWHVQELGEAANDLEALSTAFQRARDERTRPSLIIVRSHIAFGAPHAQDTPEAHGAPLGEEEVRQTKRAYGWPQEAQFLVPDRVRAHMGQARARGRRLEGQWNAAFGAYREAHPELGRQFERTVAGQLPPGWDKGLPAFPAGQPLATRSAAGTALNHFAARLPELVGGAADLASSTQAYLKEGGDIARGAYRHRNIRWGVREHVMCAASSGMALHGGVRPFASTFFIFTDYARPALRLAALMRLPVIYLLSHDSIGLGEDGPTHQPVEHLASFRAMPGMTVIRPADANETVQALRVALARQEGPTMVLLTRQKVPVPDRDRLAPAEGLARGAYVLSEAEGGTPEVILLASGSEVQCVLEAQARLLADHQVRARVVSMPSWELFREQPAEYREAVLPPALRRRLAVEAGASFGWCEWVGEAGAVIAVDRFGASAPGKDILQRYGFTAEHVVEEALRLMER